MPKVVHEALLLPRSFTGLSNESINTLLVEEMERLIANARSVAFYAIRSSMDGNGSVAQSERVYVLMRLAELIRQLLTEPQPLEPPTRWVNHVEVEYRSLEARARKHWEDHGGVLGFLRPLTLTTEQTRIRGLIESAARSHEELAQTHPSGPDKIKAETLRRFAEVFL